MVLHHLGITSSARSLADLVHEVEGGNLTLDPPYQRGSVWTPEQRMALIESIMRGIPIAAIVLNKRGDNRAWEQRYGTVRWDDPYYACIDGKQRLTTVLMWMRGEVEVPSSWFAPERLLNPGLSLVSYVGLDPVGQRFFKNQAILPIAEARLESVEQEATVYGLINFSGTAQTDADMARARKVAEA